MNSKIDLTLETLEQLEAPITDMEWGVMASLAFGVGLAIGVGAALT